MSIVEVVGRSCRLPGANSVSRFWDLLTARECSVTRVPEERFAQSWYFNPRRGEPGKAYTFAAGVIDDVWGFDPGVFSITPREARQMDPQQRLVLQLVWEALEDAGVPPSSLARQNIGVYMGASSMDHSHRQYFDPAGTDSYLMTGNTLSLISNRVSYQFDLIGPSLTIDTACSSSLVALDYAMQDLRAGKIDAAIVGGVNGLLSPFNFMGFCAASMLSPDGLCRAFDHRANGYVRSEGGVVMILQRAGGAYARNRTHGRILASAMNSDGRTSGVALPSMQQQAELLRTLYAAADIDPKSLAFVEAHGTGTMVGDPVECHALGTVLGAARRVKLPIGSAKSNVGHLEPASGMVGLLKAQLALEHGVLPATLHVATLNPNIPFDDLKLHVATEPVPLDHLSPARRLAGVNNFGFGGTNVHVIIGPAEARQSKAAGARPAKKRRDTVPTEQDELLLLSAQCRDGLVALARQHSERMPATGSVAEIANAIAHRRDLLPERLAVVGKSPEDVAARLRDFVEGASAPQVVSGTAVTRSAKTAFVFSGNGAQWVGMARSALERSPAFRRHFAKVDRAYQDVAGSSLKKLIAAEDLAEQIDRTEIAQPLLFAIQVAIAKCLIEKGVQPSCVVGHSVGEVAAAHISGALDLRQAASVIRARSHYQEMARGLGRMAALQASQGDAEALIRDSQLKNVTVAAINSPRSVTVAGNGDDVHKLLKIARERQLAGKLLDIQYPFHTARLEPARRPIVEALSGVKPGDTEIALYSTVTGQVIEGRELDAQYWWKNVREPVRFLDAIAGATKQGCQVFVEISPRSILRSYITDCLAGADLETRVIPTFEPIDDKSDVDPVATVLARALVAGAAFDRDALFGPPSVASIPLPHYPWQNKEFRMAPSVEAMGTFSSSHVQHPVLGARLRSEDVEWERQLDIAVLPYLADHKVGDRTIMPGTAYVEAALAAAVHQLKSEHVELRDLDFVQALELSADTTQQLHTRVDPDSGSIVISSRARLSSDERQVHMRGRFATAPSTRQPSTQAPDRQSRLDAPPREEIYRLAQRFNLNYGPAFRRVTACRELGDSIVEVELSAAEDGANAAAEQYFLHPVDFDACLHGLNVIYPRLAFGENKLSFVPVRIGTLRVFQLKARLGSARIHLSRYSKRGAVADFELFGHDGTLVAIAKGVRLRAATLVHRLKLGQAAYHVGAVMHALPAESHVGNVPPVEALRQHAVEASHSFSAEERASLRENRLLIELAARRVLYDAARSRVDEHGVLAPPTSDAGALNHCWSLMEQIGVLHVRDGARLLAPQGTLPSLAEIVNSVIEDDPGWSAECTMLLNAAEQIQIAQTAVPSDMLEIAAWHSASTIEHFQSSAPLARAQISALVRGIKSAIGLASPERPFRILQIGGNGGLVRELAAFLEQRHVQLTIAEADARLMARLQSQWQGKAGLEFIGIEAGLDELRANAPFDAVVILNALGRMTGARNPISALRTVLANRAMLLISERDPDLFHEVVFAADASEGAFRLRDRSSWREGLRAAGFNVFDTTDEDDGVPGACLLFAEWNAKQTELPVDRTVSVGEPRAIFVLGQAGKGKARLEPVLVDALSRHNATSTFCDLSVAPRKPSAGKSKLASKQEAREGALNWQPLIRQIDKLSGAAEIAFTLGASAASPQSHMAALRSRLVALTELLQSLGDRSARIWVLAEGGARALTGHGTACPVQTGVWSFVRTAMNEYAKLDLRLVDVAEDLPVSLKAERLALLMSAPSEAREFVLTADGMAVLEVRRGAPKVAASAQRLDLASDGSAVVLRQREQGNLDELTWVRSERRAPGEHEVEVEVVSSGLNFRDVMWSLGLLPEEALEDGFAGPTIGFECSGRVARIGRNVAGLAIGDPVIAIAPASFASHVTVAARAVGRLPGNVPLHAAACIPVPFLTACYALEHLAHVRKGEWVLIHGAAGGVGLAAIQVARRNGARIIATAGSDEKRNFLRRLGAHVVLDTRSLDFVDQVRDITENGVSIVLNSLAGEAMERSIELLRPFGRFIELGKRDFYSSTKISVRPFRNNISYFGVDADQLLTYEPEVAQHVLTSVIAGFESGDFSPLPCRIFRSDEVVDAFRLMQKSGHIGKIIVEAPRLDQAKSDRDAEHKVAEQGYHVIFGGTGGFGLEYAHWLADRGAQHILIASRSGGSGAEVTALAETLQRRGISLTSASCDVTDKKAVASLLQRLRKERPIVGITHTAMVLDDALIKSLTADRLDKVLAPKVIGARNLDLLTRDDKLDYFILFSSAAAMFGNPGQGNYVAANGYLDGLAMQRRANGLPALSVAWGAITDVGVLTRDKSTAKSLARHTGGVSFTAREALDLLARVLVDESGARPAAVSLAAMNWQLAKDLLPIMNSPAYAVIRREAQAQGESGPAGSDLRAIVLTLDQAAARDAVSEYLRNEVANIFRMPPEDINPKRSLTDIGMDSLMGLELRMAVERQIGVDIMKVSMSNGTTIHDIADHIASKLRSSVAEDEIASSEQSLMVSQHVTEVIDLEDLRHFEGEIVARETQLRRRVV